jgi:type II secretory pathway predicted ATPase ExeA
MYESFFGLRERPFDLTPNPQYLVLTDVHREALSNLDYGINSRKGITLLLGEAGSGKTTVIRAAVDRQPARVHCVHLNNPALSREEFVEMLAGRFGFSEAARTSKAALLMELETFLKSRRSFGETTVLIVDEAQALPSELLEEIRLLANIETDKEKLLLLVLAGQPELAERLNEQGLRQLKQRIALRCELRPLTLQETAAYIAGRIKAAGGVGAQVFTLEAVTKIFERSRGIPRVISVIADNALVGAFARGQRPVKSQIVLEVCKDFDFTGADRPEEHGFPSEGGQAGPSRVLDLAQAVAAKHSDAAPKAAASRPAESSGGRVARLLSAPESRWRRFFLERRSVQR